MDELLTQVRDDVERGQHARRRQQRLLGAIAIAIAIGFGLGSARAAGGNQDGYALAYVLIGLFLAGCAIIAFADGFGRR